MFFVSSLDGWLVGLSSAVPDCFTLLEWRGLCTRNNKKKNAMIIMEGEREDEEK